MMARKRTIMMVLLGALILSAMVLWGMRGESVKQSADAQPTLANFSVVNDSATCYKDGAACSMGDDDVCCSKKCTGGSCCTPSGNSCDKETTVCCIRGLGCNSEGKCP